MFFFLRIFEVEEFCINFKKTTLKDQLMIRMYDLHFRIRVISLNEWKEMPSLINFISIY